MPISAWSQPGQPILIWRNQFDGAIQRPPIDLTDADSVTIGSDPWRIVGVTALRVVSPEPEIAAVFQFQTARSETAGPDAQPPGTAFRLTVVVIANPGQRRFLYTLHGNRIAGDEVGAEMQPQHVFRVGKQGVSTGLTSSQGQVAEIELQDDGDTEIRMRRDGNVLEIEVVPPEQGGIPSGTGPPYYNKRPLRFADADLIAAGYTDNGLGELWLFGHIVGKANAFLGDDGDATLLRGLVTAQAWRSRTLSLWAEGGVGVIRIDPGAGGTSEEETRAAGGLTLHWRYTSWGAALHVGLVGDSTVLTAYGGWQIWTRVSALLSWQSFEGESGTGIGIGIGF